VLVFAIVIIPQGQCRHSSHGARRRIRAGAGGFVKRRAVRLLVTGVAVLLGAPIVVACSGSPATAGNAALEFQISVQTSDYQRAYLLLCQAERDRTTADEFATSRPIEMQPFLALTSTVGAAAQYPPMATTNDDVGDAWVEYEGQRWGQTETWRVGLVREDGDWRVCTFAKTASRMAPPDTNFSPTTIA